MAPLPNTRVQRTRSSASPLRSPLMRYPLGSARGSGALDDSCELSSGGSGGYQGAEEQIESNGRVSSLHLCHARLAGANELGKTSLGQMSSFASQTQALGERNPELDKLGLLFGESQKLAGRANLPACGLEFLPLPGFHVHLTCSP
jgi:hypothetical protein